MPGTLFNGYPCSSAPRYGTVPSPGLLVGAATVPNGCIVNYPWGNPLGRGYTNMMTIGNFYLKLLLEI